MAPKNLRNLWTDPKKDIQKILAVGIRKFLKNSGKNLGETFKSINEIFFIEHLGELLRGLQKYIFFGELSNALLEGYLFRRMPRDIYKRPRKNSRIIGWRDL